MKLTYDQPFGNYFTKFPTEIASNTEPDLVAIQSCEPRGSRRFHATEHFRVDTEGLSGLSLSQYNQGIVNGSGTLPGN